MQGTKDNRPVTCQAEDGRPVTCEAEDTRICAGHETVDWEVRVICQTTLDFSQVTNCSFKTITYSSSFQCT